MVEEIQEQQRDLETLNSTEESSTQVKEAREKLEEEISNYREIREHFEREFRRTGYIPRWPNYNAVRQFKSVRRAIRRGHVDLFSGMIYPDRPFSNKKATKGREMNELKKAIYGQLHKRAV